MAKKYKPISELFSKEYDHIKVEFPVLIKFKSGNLEIFHQNGVREYLRVDRSKGETSYGKSKTTTDESQYLFFIRRLISINSEGDQKDWDDKILEMNEINGKVDLCKLEETLSDCVARIQDEVQGQEEIAMLNEEKNITYEPDEEENREID